MKVGFTAGLLHYTASVLARCTYNWQLCIYVHGCVCLCLSTSLYVHMYGPHGSMLDLCILHFVVLKEALLPSHSDIPHETSALNTFAIKWYFDWFQDWQGKIDFLIFIIIHDGWGWYFTTLLSLFLPSLIYVTHTIWWIYNNVVNTITLVIMWPDYL